MVYKPFLDQVKSKENEQIYIDDIDIMEIQNKACNSKC